MGWNMEIREMKENGYVRIIKPLLDRFLGTLGLIILALPMLFISIAIRIESKGPIVFQQKRVGKKVDGQLTYFIIYKFRTMYADAPKDTPTHMMGDLDKWLTTVGRFLRKYSLDELPQLWNIAITHDLSFVGPRPALWNQEDLIEERDKYEANDVMPGLTGWAQINGRDELNILEKAWYDGEYVKRMHEGSLSAAVMDIRCFFITIFKTISSEGVLEGKNDRDE